MKKLSFKTYNIDRIPYDKIPEEYLSVYALGLFDGNGGLSYSKDFSSDVTFGYTAYHESEVADFQDLINKLINKEQKIRTFLLQLGIRNGEVDYKFFQF